MALKLKLLKLENFGPFVEATITLDDKGLVLILGDNQVSSSADSNGSGKSSLLEGIVYGIYGKTIRYDLDAKKPTGDLMVNTKFGPTPGKNCCVTQLWDMDGRLVEIKRHRKDKTNKNAVMVAIDGTDYTRGTAKETDRFIEELVGLDCNAFVRSVYFDAASIVPFPTLSDAEIKAVFEKVLGLDDLSKVADVVKAKLKIELANKAQADNEIRLEASHASTAEVERQMAVGRQGEFEHDRARDVAGLKTEIATLAAAAIRPAAEIDADAAQIDALEAELLAKLAGFDPLDGLVQKWTVDRTSKAAEITQRQAAIAQLSNRTLAATDDTRLATQRLVDEHQRLTLERTRAGTDQQNAAAKIGQPCGECGKPYTNDDLGHIVAHATNRIAEIDRRLAEVAAEHAALIAKGKREIDDQRLALEAVIAQAEADLAALQGELAALDAKAEQFDKLKALRADAQRRLQELPTARSALQTQRHARATNDAASASLRARIDELAAKPNPYGADVTRWEERKTAHTAAKEAHEARAAECERQIAMLRVLDEAYGRTGLKAHILETVTPVLNARANDYATRLADGAVTIEFSTVTKLRDGTYAERFSVNVANDQGAEGYHGNSSGEKRKIDLSIALAMSDLVAARSNKAVDLWVCDEVAESLDPTAVDRVVAVLKQKATERGTLLVISHTRMDDLIPNVVTVRKLASGSEIVGGSGSGW